MRGGRSRVGRGLMRVPVCTGKLDMLASATCSAETTGKSPSKARTWERLSPYTTGAPCEIPQKCSGAHFFKTAPRGFHKCSTWIPQRNSVQSPTTDCTGIWRGPGDIRLSAFWTFYIDFSSVRRYFLWVRPGWARPRCVGLI